MSTYYGKYFEASQIGGYIAEATCEKCGCKYYYRLTRIGAGGSSAPFNIGTAQASQSAWQKAQRDLQKRLASEADHVPCPKCNWINHELIRKYRRGRFRGFNKFALAIAIMGAASSLPCAWSIGIGPQNDRWLLPYILVGGPAFSWLLAASLILLRNLLRLSIRPNRNFPQPPTLPFGTPPAMLTDDATGKLQPVRSRVTAEWQDFEIGQHTLPSLCCHCLGRPDQALAYLIQVTQLLTVRVPRCPACARSVKWKFWGILCAVIVGGMGLGAAGFTLAGMQSAQWWSAVCWSFVVSLAIAYVVAFKYSGPPFKATIDPGQGLIRFHFWNREYARLLAVEMARANEETGHRDEKGPESGDGAYTAK
jgi:hypothetical protein